MDTGDTLSESESEEPSTITHPDSPRPPRKEKETTTNTPTIIKTIPKERLITPIKPTLNVNERTERKIKTITKDIKVDTKPPSNRKIAAKLARQ